MYLHIYTMEMQKPSLYWLMSKAILILINVTYYSTEYTKFVLNFYALRLVSITCITSLDYFYLMICL